ncbi:MAG: SMP-30/gluconolactonase/LRE family protein [Leptolyngbyaceae cyanobacterium MAG.088]|nr:SMP-30/gluconolactonase/LRE family protein [Leptolyngbyaceae cyanobacterium MAG.088]
MKRSTFLRLGLLTIPTTLLPGMMQTKGQANTPYPTIGKLISYDSKFEQLIPSDSQLDVIASGFEWAEGPVWIKEGEFLLFSDVPRNSIMKWDQESGLSLFMHPSGYTGAADYGNNNGSNGLLLDPQGRLVLCEHGDRRISQMPWDGGKRTLVDAYNGKRLNSPNDAVFHSNGDLYFTDPPYGFPGYVDDPRRELDFAGVYRLSTTGELTLLTKEMTFPNGLAFSPDEGTLYVAQSDPNAALWKAFSVNKDGTLGQSQTFYDVTSSVGQLRGLPDGLKVDQRGHIFATGPGGIYVFTPDATLLGKIETNVAAANCGWGEDGSVLYITADSYLLRLQTNTKGSGW